MPKLMIYGDERYQNTGALLVLDTEEKATKQGMWVSSNSDC